MDVITLHRNPCVKLENCVDTLFVEALLLHFIHILLSEQREGEGKVSSNKTCSRECHRTVSCNLDILIFIPFKS